MPSMNSKNMSASGQDLGLGAGLTQQLQDEEEERKKKLLRQAQQAGGSMNQTLGGAAGSLLGPKGVY